MTFILIIDEKKNVLGKLEVSTYTSKHNYLLYPTAKAFKRKLAYTLIKKEWLKNKRAYINKKGIFRFNKNEDPYEMYAAIKNKMLNLKIMIQD